jgi:mycobactin phenyloxazoline synthetase
MLAAVVGADDPTLSVDGLRDGIAELVPAHMIPRHFEVVDRIPYTVGGKTDRREVARILADAVRAGDIASGRRTPSTPLESALATIVAELVGANEVGVDDDFFELGGDSVLATTAVARIRNWLDTPTVMVADIFATRTVAALATRLIGCEPDGGRLEQVAELYLEVKDMDNADVLAALDTSSAS